jgi:hypothetical protein
MGYSDGEVVLITGAAGDWALLLRITSLRKAFNFSSAISRPVDWLEFCD